MTEPVSVGDQLAAAEITRSTNCSDCGTTFNAPVILLAGKPLFPHRLCPACAAAFERAEQVKAEAKRARLLAERLALIPKMYMGATVSDRGVLDWVGGFLKRSPRWLYVQGPVGVGKTHQAWGAWRAIAEARPETTLSAWRGASLFTRLRAAGFEAEGDIWRAQRADLLLVDDLATRKQTDWEVDRLLEILDERLQQERPVLVTSNIPVHHLAGDDWVDDRIESRIASAADVVVLDGPDRRRS